MNTLHDARTPIGLALERQSEMLRQARNEHLLRGLAASRKGTMRILLLAWSAVIPAALAMALWIAQR